MAFTDAIDVDPGDAVLASHVDNLADNTEFNREKADASLDMDISTGDGYMRADHATPLKIKNEDATPDVVSVALHVDADGGYWLPVRSGDQSSVTNSNAEGYIPITPISDLPGGIPA